jgi:hypothetical protein
MAIISSSRYIGRGLLQIDSTLHTWYLVNAAEISNFDLWCNASVVALCLTSAP